MTTKEICKAHGLDFTIIKRPLVGVEGDTQHITPYYGLFNSKSGECINTCKEGYGVSQNEEIIDMVLQGIKPYGSALEVSKAASINGGRRIMIQLKVEGTARVGNDTITQYITIIDSNDGSTGLSVGIGDIAAHCQNQFFKFYKAGNAKFRHTATIQEKIKTIPSLIEIALKEKVKQVEIYNKFLSTEVSRDLAHKLVHEVLGYDRVITSKAEYEKLTKRSIDLMDTLYAAIDTEIEQVGLNLHGLFNGVTRFTTHHQKTPKRDNGHIESLVVGTGYNKAIAGFDFCLAQMS